MDKHLDLNIRLKRAARVANEMVMPEIRKEHEKNVRVYEMNVARREKAEKKKFRHLESDASKTPKSDVQKNKTKRDRFKPKKLPLYKVSKALFLGVEVKKGVKKAKRKMKFLEAKEKQEEGKLESDTKKRQKGFDPTTQTEVYI